MYPNDLERMIRDALPDASVELEDLRGDGEHYAAYVESAMFDGVALVDQHRMIYRALRGHVGGLVQTLTLKTALPSRERPRMNG